MTKKNITITALAAALVLAMAAWAVAGPGYGRGFGGCGGPGYGQGNAYGQLSPEKQAAAQEIFEKYDDQFDELRTEMWTKHSTLQAMVNGGEADEAKIGKLTAELTQIGEKIRDLRQKMSDELVAETGITTGGGFGACPAYGQAACPGYGRGGRGLQRGMY